MKDLDIKNIFEAMKTNDISELIIKEGSKLYEIRRGGFKQSTASQSPVQSIPHVFHGAAPSVIQPQQQPASTIIHAEKKPSIDVELEEKKSDLYELKSPLVGTFYASAKPDAPPFVVVGDKVKKGQTLCIVEAMKNFNEIESEVDGIVDEICVGNMDLVEFGKVLFRIKL